MYKFRIEIKWALILMIVSLAWVGMENRAGLHGSRIDQQMKYSYIYGAVAFIIYVMALRDKKYNFYNGLMNWQQGFISGVILSFIIALFSPVSQMIVHKIIAPSYLQNAIEHGVSMGGNEEFLRSYYNLKAQIIYAFVESLSFGMIASALISYFIRKR